MKSNPKLAKEIKKASKILAKAKSDMVKVAKKAMTDASKSIFDNHPKLNSFSWAQYTPYFNDGDTCEFYVHSDYFKMDIGGYKLASVSPYAGKVAYEVYLNGEYVDSELSKELDGAIKKAAFDIEELISGIDEDIMRDIYGDHVEVTVTRKGIKIEDHEHE